MHGCRSYLSIKQFFHCATSGAGEQVQGSLDTPQAPSSYKELLDSVVLSSVHETCLLNHSAATYLTSAFKTTCTLPCTGHAHWPVGSAARTVDAFPAQSNCKNRLSASLSHLRSLIQGISCRVQPAYAKWSITVWQILSNMSLEEQGIWAHYWAAGHSLSVQGAKLAYLYSQECL